MRLNNKAWVLGGAVLGLVLPFAIAAYERVLILEPVRPIVHWILWPTSLFLKFSQPPSTVTGVILFFFTAIGNAALYGWLASQLRRASLGVALLLLVVVWFFLPPSDIVLRERFNEHRHDLERLVQMADGDAQLVQIAPNMVETIDGKRFDASAPPKCLSGARWAEYRQLFKAVGLNDGLYKSPTGGEIFLSTRRLRRIDPVGSSFGYLYCPSVNQENGYLPCMENQASAERGGYRWDRLESGWYIFEIFQSGIQ